MTLLLPKPAELAKFAFCPMQEALALGGFEALMGAFTPEELEALRFLMDLWATPLRRLPDQPKGENPGWGRWAGQWPLPPGFWKFALLIGGRGTGKSTGAVNWFVNKVHDNPNKQFAIVGTSFDAAWDSCVTSPITGILAWALPGMELEARKGDAQVACRSNGSVIYVLSGKAPETIRNHNNLCSAWVEEPEGMEYLDEVFTLLDGSVRHGEKPQVVFTANPKKGKSLLTTMQTMKEACVVQSSALENPTLSEAQYLSSIRPKLGTPAAREFVYGQQLADEAEAVFHREWFHPATPAQIDAVRWKRIGIAVDPAETSKPNADDTGIVVGGVDEDGFGYLTLDATAKVEKGKRKPTWSECARTAVVLYWQKGASFIVVDAGRNGEGFSNQIQAEAKLYAIEEKEPRYASVRVICKGGNKDKATLAYPVANQLYLHAKVKHAPGLDAVEDEMCTWTPASKWSPNRMDAAAALLTELMLKTPPPSQAGLNSRPLLPRRI